MVVRYLAAADVMDMNDRLLRASQGVPSTLLDKRGLESAVLRPQMAAHYEQDEQADLAAQAATLIVGIALAHAFLDGNKRTALIAGIVFLHANGYRLVSEPLETARQVEALVVREHPLPETLGRFAEWLRSHVQPMR